MYPTILRHTPRQRFATYFSNPVGVVNILCGECWVWLMLSFTNDVVDIAIYYMYGVVNVIFCTGCGECMVW